MKKLYYLPYSMVSGSIKELQNVLGGLKIKEKGNYIFSPNHLVVNWGHSGAPYWGTNVGPRKNILNHWSKLNVAINKLSAFKKFKDAGVPTPEWTASRKEAESYFANGGVVICRTLLSSMEGKGIVVATKPSELVDAPLYTKLFPKDKEYRVHVFNGEVIDYVQKKLKSDAPANRCKYIRNTANGWIFARSAVVLPETVKKQAQEAIKALGLDFGAVDLATGKSSKVVVFEVNTAPGIEGTTVQKYSQAISKYKETL
jgi:glutathione synthase/RimK-type ligase-like ATP-grasp enzyme